MSNYSILRGKNIAVKFIIKILSDHSIIVTQHLMNVSGKKAMNFILFDKKKSPTAPCDNLNDKRTRTTSIEQ